jgi:hypothetical protein
MDRTDLIEQLVVIEDCGAAGEDDDAAAGKSTINDVTDSTTTASPLRFASSA